MPDESKRLIDDLEIMKGGWKHAVYNKHIVPKLKRNFS